MQNKKCNFELCIINNYKKSDVRIFEIFNEVFIILYMTLISEFR